MSKKIVILGALGYLGTELCKLYSGESWFHNIVAIDSRFVSKRVNQLKDWNIKFYQGEILDEKFLSKHLHNADILHHLAGVTDVAYVKKESNAPQDEKIKKIAHDHTCSIIMPPKYMLSDNAAMIGWACIQKYLLNEFSDLYFKVNPRLTIKDCN